MESVKPPVITEYQESYPSELSIIYSAICTVEGICKENYINRGSVTMVCDSLGEIQKSMAKETSLGSKSNNFNIILAIGSKMTSIPIYWYWRHGKGRQYDHYIPLYRWASLSVKYK